MKDYRIGGKIGGYFGAAVGIYGTIKLGYELGSFVNDFFDVSNSLIRGLADVGFMVGLVDPLFRSMAYCGRQIGIASEATLNKVVDGVRDLSDFIK